MSSFNLLPENDPCTAAYQRSPRKDTKTSVSSNKRSARKAFRAKARKVRVAFIRSIKRIFGIKSRDSTPTFIMMTKKSPGFVTPTELKRLSQSSMRSRRSSTKMTGNDNQLSVPSVLVTTPTLQRTRSTYRVHSFSGTGSSPMAGKGTVRFSHPTVSNTATAQSTPDLLRISEDDNTNQNRSPRASNLTDDSQSSGFPEITVDEHGRTLLKPKTLYRWSAQSVTTEGARETFDEFKARLDGHKGRADRTVSERPPSLPCIPRMGTLKIPMDDTPDVTSAVTEPTHVQEHRSNALNALEGSSASDRYVLAIMPRKDLPITAIQVASSGVPSSLIPGGDPKSRPPMTRPHTFHVPQTFQAYSPSFSPPTTQEENNTPKVELSSKRENRKQRVFDSQEFFDMPKFDAEKTSGLNSRHSKYYHDVESGVFGDANATSMHMHTPAPRSPVKFGPSTKATSSFLLLPSPPSPTSKPTQLPTNTNGQKVIPRKPVTTPPTNYSKPLPPVPAIYKALQPSKPVKPIPMNANGYPTLTAHPSKRFSTEPKYERRTLNDVEAKYQREQARKGKRSKTSSKGDAQAGQQGEKKRSEMLVLEGQLKHLMG